MALASKLRFSKRNLEKSKQVNNAQQIEIHEQDCAHSQFFADFYAETMNNFTLILHPYYEGNKSNDSKKVKEEIKDEISKIKDIISQCNIKDKYNLLAKAENQINDLVSIINQWHQIIDSHIEDLSLTMEIKNWFRNYYLPKTYWQSAIYKTKYKLTKDRLRTELSKCNAQRIARPDDISKELFEKLKAKADELCRKFQRTSSQVEGRNGYLSMINHNQRGFDENRLKVLTVIHNFDIYGMDGRTPAERLFGDKIKHDKIIDYLIQNFGDLPLPRKRIIQVSDN